MKGIVALVLIGLIAFTSATQCEDGSQCPNGSTCCLLAGGQYGCCPYGNATCCSDKLHCCPESYTCDLTSGACVHAQGFNEFLSYVGLMNRLTPSEVAVESAEDVKKCIADIPIIVADFTRLIKDYQEKKIVDIIKAVALAIKDSKLAYEDCKNAVKDLVKEEFEKLESVEGIEKCLEDIPVFAQIITKLVTDAKAKNIEAIISDIEAAIKEGEVVYADCKDALTAKRVEGDVNTCIADIQELVDDITTIFDDIKAQDFQKLTQDVEKTIQDGQKAVQDCQN